MRLSLGWGQGGSTERAGGSVQHRGSLRRLHGTDRRLVVYLALTVAKIADHGSR